MSVKGSGNTFDLNPKRDGTLPTFGNFSYDINRVPPPKSKYQSRFLHPAVDVRCRIPPMHLSQ
jgi:hypothetical protein